MNKVFTVLLVSVCLIVVGCDSYKDCTEESTVIRHEWRLVYGEANKLRINIDIIPFQGNIVAEIDKFMESITPHISKHKGYECELHINEWSDISHAWNGIYTVADYYTTGTKLTTGAIDFGTVVLNVPIGFVIARSTGVMSDKFQDMATNAKERFNKANSMVESLSTGDN